MKKKSTISPNANPYGQVGSHNTEVNKLIMAVDQVAYTMETKWGSGVLPNLVEQPIHDKFMRAVDRLNDAIPTNDYDTVKAAADNLIKGWHKLNELATAAGYDNIPSYLTLTDSGGVEYLIVQTNQDASRLAAKMLDSASAIHTAQTIADLITRTYSVTAHHITTKLELVRTKQPMEDILGDEIPF